MQWKPADIAAVRVIVQNDLGACDEEQRKTYERYAVEPFYAPIVRYGLLENVIVVARREDEVIYWEDIEEGFNLSALGADGTILEHFCNQDDLGLALNAWIQGRSDSPRILSRESPDRRRTQP